MSDHNAFPDGWREITEAEFVRSAYFSQVPEKRDYRQMLDSGTRDPAKLDLSGRELYMCATLYSYADKTGIALASEHERGRVRFFAFGCPHEFHGLTVAEERKLGVSYQSLQCGTCGLIVGKPDSSD